MLGLIEAFLTQSVIEPNGTETKPTKGSPQGGSISPLLANIYLDPLDWLLSERGLQSVRYADDIVILTTSAEQAQRALEQVQQWMERAQLTLHPEKTRLVDMTTPRAHFDFLGYRFLRTKGGKFLRLVRPKSKTKVRETLRIITRRSNGQSLEAIIQQANQVLRGWGNYFVQAHASEHQQMDGWMRKRLRAILVKRAKRRGNGQGWSHKQWPNDSFTALGLYSLEMARALFKASLRKEGAKC